MGNILNHNRGFIKFKMTTEDYWDFQLCIDDTSYDIEEGLVERCLSAYIDLSDDECIWWDDIYSKKEYVWNEALNTNTLLLKNFGFTSVDNGKTLFERDRITNREFYELFTTTKFTPNEDLRFTLTKVNGNNQLYDYSNDISMWNDKIQCSKLNGGWYQGFFRANDGNEYQVLPTDLGNGWNFEFILNKEDFENDKLTFNDVYPNNKGIFFYIGTRAENKWWRKYLTEHDFEWCSKHAFGNEYVDSEYIENDTLNSHYIKDITDEYYKSLVEVYENTGYFADDYIMEESTEESAFDSEYYNGDTGENMNSYVEEGYIEKDMFIDEDMKLVTNEGYDFYQPNVKRLKTDNKFIIFDNTKEGMTADKWDENTEVEYEYIKKPNIGNYFTMLHKGCGGYDVCKIEKLLQIRNKEYNVLKDIYRNALAFQIKDDGTLGYKYLVRDCEAEVENYKIETEFTKDSIIENGKWYDINIKVIPTKRKVASNEKCVGQNSANDEMQIYFYVNGKLVLISKRLPIINLRALDDLYEKQEGVPFNISLGGGTQGLGEVIYLNYMKNPEFVLPLEKEFAGSFIGWLKTFRFYNCPLNYNEIVKNYNFSKNI